MSDLTIEHTANAQDSWRAFGAQHLLCPDQGPEGRAWPMARADRERAMGCGVQNRRTPEGAWRSVEAERRGGSPGSRSSLDATQLHGSSYSKLERGSRPSVGTHSRCRAVFSFQPTDLRITTSRVRPFGRGAHPGSMRRAQARRAARSS
jgi:hypothetical protein